MTNEPDTNTPAETRKCIQTMNIGGLPLKGPCETIAFTGKHDKDWCGNPDASCSHHIPTYAAPSPVETPSRHCPFGNLLCAIGKLCIHCYNAAEHKRRFPESVPVATEPVLSGFTADEIDVMRADVLQAADRCYDGIGSLKEPYLSKRIARGDLRYALAGKIERAAGCASISYRPPAQPSAPTLCHACSTEPTSYEVVRQPDGTWLLFEIYSHLGGDDGHAVPKNGKPVEVIDGLSELRPESVPSSASDVSHAAVTDVRLLHERIAERDRMIADYLEASMVRSQTLADRGKHVDHQAAQIATLRGSLEFYVQSCCARDDTIARLQRDARALVGATQKLIDFSHYQLYADIKTAHKALCSSLAEVEKVGGTKL